MKYEDYKQLTEEQKEEWNFKYKNIEPPNNNALVYAAFIWTTMQSFAAVALVILKEYVEVKMPIAEFFVSGMKLTLILMIAYFITTAIQWGYYFNKKHKEKKWLKEVQ